MYTWWVLVYISFTNTSHWWTDRKQVITCHKNKAKWCILHNGWLKPNLYQFPHALNPSFRFSVLSSLSSFCLFLSPLPLSPSDLIFYLPISRSVNLYNPLPFPVWFYIFIFLSLCPYLPISLSPYLPISLSPYLSISLSPYLPISLSPYLTISLSPYLPISLSPYLPISLSPYLSISLSPYLPISLSPYLTISLSPYLPISLSLHLSISLSVFRPIPPQWTHVQCHFNTTIVTSLMFVHRHTYCVYKMWPSWQVRETAAVWNQFSSQTVRHH